MAVTAAAAVWSGCGASPTEPSEVTQPAPFPNTIEVAPDALTVSDATALATLSYSGQGVRRLWDRRTGGYVTVEAFLFGAAFDDGLTTEVHVNPEFGSSEVAGREAARFAEAVGRLPATLRAGVRALWIHRGNQLFGAWDGIAIGIHTGQADWYEAHGILEETLAHEATHLALDGRHASSPGWVAARNADHRFISTYAQQYPEREDLAESFVVYLAVRRRPDRISPETRRTILDAIPHRIAYLDRLAMDWHPVQ